MKRKNRYFLMRHGESEANVRDLIVSSVISGVEEYGLTENGIAQVKRSLAHLHHEINDPIVIASDFLRTRDTARIVAEHFEADVQMEPKLRERFFGKFDGKHRNHYFDIWKHDEKKEIAFDIEPIDIVFERAFLVIEKAEGKYTKKDIFLVSHGDVLNILYSHLCEHPTHMHHLEHLQFRTAEIRIINPDS